MDRLEISPRSEPSAEANVPSTDETDHQLLDELPMKKSEEISSEVHACEVFDEMLCKERVKECEEFDENLVEKQKMKVT